MVEEGLIVLLSFLEVARHWYFIEIKKIDLSANDPWKYPSHYWSTVERVAAWVVFSVLCGFVFYAPLLFYFIFQYGLNVVRRKSLFHTGKSTFDSYIRRIDDKIGKSWRLAIHFLICIVIPTIYALNK